MAIFFKVRLIVYTPSMLILTRTGAGMFRRPGSDNEPISESFVLGKIHTCVQTFVLNFGSNRIYNILNLLTIRNK